mmetsp:Transcript_49332/g.81145  ORF Transcript_49332/g.81145 Transcript_49332/m.81145 type:complete len:128 (-) Transcript_49332:737-1120(-)
MTNTQVHESNMHEVVYQFSWSSTGQQHNVVGSTLSSLRERRRGTVENGTHSHSVSHPTTMWQQCSTLAIWALLSMCLGFNGNHVESYSCLGTDNKPHKEKKGEEKGRKLTNRNSTQKDEQATLNEKQ